MFLIIKDTAGKRLDQDFDGKEYLLPDAESQCWTIKLSVKKIEKENFLDDIRRNSPNSTYVLSYETSTGGRHAVYIQSCDYNIVRCINSWGNNNRPYMEIPLNQSGNTFYRIFCRTFVVLSSKGPSAEWWGGCLGVFEYLEPHNNSPAYRQRNTVAGTRPHYLYRDHGGDWHVGPELGSSGGLLNRTNSESVPTNNWLYGVEELESDPELTVTTSLSPVCGVITISLHGAAATAQPETGGEYRATGDWSAGRRVFSNGITYLCVRPGWTGWCVTDSLDTDRAGIRLVSGCVTWCPASPRAAVSHRYKKSSWRYWSNTSYREGDIRITCDGR